MTASAALFPGISIVDTDTHWSEPEDLWTSRAPAAMRDRVPQVRTLNGKRRWVVDGEVQLGPAHATSAIAADGTKIVGLDFLGMTNADVHAACHDVTARLQMMDALGIRAATVYPNVAGFGSQNFLRVADDGLRMACVEIYNDAMAELQDASAGRLLPMAMVPWWDPAAVPAEIERAHGLGLRGIVTCSNPHDSGRPNYGQPEWEPQWETCVGLGMPVNFHIGASEGDLDWFGRTPWPTWPGEVKLTIGGAGLFMGNARWLANLLFTDVFERHPELRIVSVESGIGWLPFFLESLDYQAGETAPHHLAHMSMKPSEYFRRNFYATFWFETAVVAAAIEYLGADHVMFETDFPHPTCLYPSSVERIHATLSRLDPEVQRKVLSANATELYRITA
jgi:predicted TIM-barrel fold metal-dependent hydrolase